MAGILLAQNFNQVSEFKTEHIGQQELLIKDVQSNVPGT